MSAGPQHRELCLPRGLRGIEVSVRVAEISAFDLIRLWEIFKFPEMRIIILQEVL